MAKPPSITIVVARAINGTIGKDGKLPWHLPGDLKHFKQGALQRVGSGAHRTAGVAHQFGDQQEGVEVAHSKEEALKLAGDDAVTIIGGSDVFAMFHDDADRIELTEVLAEIEGDTFMPDPRSEGSWREIACEDHLPEGRREGFRFTTLVRA